ncbi:MAG: sigma 54-interacting transcriptional regulator [Myxococcota bacterium]
MPQSRILPLLGPAAVLYLAAEIAAERQGLDWLAGVGIGTAFVLSLTPFWLRRRGADPGARRAGLLGVAVAIALTATMAGEPAPSLPVALCEALGWTVGAALLIDLAITVPDRPRALDRAVALRPLGYVVGVFAFAMGVGSALPLPADETFVVPATWRYAPRLCFGGALVVAVGLRFARRGWGSSPEALASSAWALLGSFVGTVSFLVGVGLTVLEGSVVPWFTGVLLGGTVAVVAGHAAMIDRTRRVAVGAVTRTVVLAILTLGAAAFFVVVVTAFAPVRAELVPIFALGTVGVAVICWFALRPVVDFALTPHGGRLLRAIEGAESATRSATTFDELVGAALPPLRRAATSRNAEPLLLSVQPAREGTVDAAAQPHSRSQPFPRALLERFQQQPGEILVREALDRLVVRRPALRSVVELMTGWDCLAVVPLSVSGELEGALVIPRGGRRAALTLEELERLTRWADSLASALALVSATFRAQQRMAESERRRADLEEELDELRAEIGRLRQDTDTLKAGRGVHRATERPIAYGPRMRELLVQLGNLAPMDGPVLLQAEAGLEIDRIAHLIHSESGRADGSFVVGDCGSVRRERAAAALFGVGGQAARGAVGWLALARGGSLLLADVPALPLEVQAELAEALATRRIRPLRSTLTVDLDVRVIATTRVPLGPLVEAGAFDPELARWLEPLSLVVPPLRDRREDFGSVILQALDRACRILGHPVLGIEQDAMAFLAKQPWPGNVRELQHTIDRAVARANGPKVLLSDLPPTAQRKEADPLEGTYQELERRILAHALERAGGNKSEAARLLGLKRTTFLDKLRRTGLRDKAGEGNQGVA